VKGTSCIGGKCSASRAGIGAACRYANDCQDGLQCQSGTCKPIAVAKKVGIACGKGNCPIGDYTCNSKQQCVLSARASKEDELHGVRLPVGQKPNKKPVYSDYGAGFATYFDADSLQNVTVVGCEYYSPTSMLAIRSDGKRQIMKGYYCCKNAATSRLTDAQNADCEAHSNYTAGYAAPITPILSQSDDLIRGTNLTLAGKSCNFEKIGCGPTSVTKIMNDSGITISNPLQLVDNYSTLNCDYGSTMEDNIQVLHTVGNMPTTPIYTLSAAREDGTLAPDDLDRLNRWLSYGHELLILVHVQVGTQSFGHYAVVQGVNSDGEMLIYDPYFNADGSIKNRSTAQNTFTLSQIDRAKFKYDIVSAVAVKQMPGDTKLEPGSSSRPQ
jgi:surface antigen